MAVRLTITDVRDLPFKDLIERAEAMVAAYDPPGTETDLQRIARIGRTLDEMPAIYRLFLTFESWCDHWTDALADQYNMRHISYKAMRERRDAMRRAASFAKMSYDAASRQITRMQSFDERGMPVSRGYQAEAT